MSDEYVFEFDKFMQDIAPSSQPVNSVPSHHEMHDELTPQREYIRRYRELPQNRTTWRR